MGKQPVRMKAVVYALSPFQQKVMSGLWKDLPGKIHHKISENWINAVLLVTPLVGTYTYVQIYQEKEKLAHRFDSWSGLVLNANRVQEMMKGWAEMEAQDEAVLVSHRDKEVKAQGPSSQEGTTKAEQRFEEELTNEVAEAEKSPAGETIQARESRGRRRPKWLNGFELDGDR